MHTRLTLRRLQAFKQIHQGRREISGWLSAFFPERATNNHPETETKKAAERKRAEEGRGTELPLEGGAVTSSTVHLVAKDDIGVETGKGQGGTGDEEPEAAEGVREEGDGQVEHDLFHGTVPTSPRTYAQPTARTHPHLVAEDEITPGIKAKEYQERRLRLAQALPPKSLVLIPAAEQKFMSHDVKFTFRQNSALYYLCGFCEPKSLLMIQTGHNNDGDIVDRTTLFLRPRDPSGELWEVGLCMDFSFFMFFLFFSFFLSLVVLFNSPGGSQGQKNPL